MITGFRGCHTSEFKISSYKPSRYGFPCLFFATSKELAVLYARYHAYENGCQFGSLYQYNIISVEKHVDFNSKLSYSSEYLQLIRSLYTKNIKSAIIKNVIDYPSKKYLVPNSSDIIVVLDFSLIKEQTLIDKYIKV
jgi:hypothetical protein